MNSQEREIATIRERRVDLKLSDADCDRISRLCGEHNITVEDLLENFIGDLVCGTYSNGSDERDFARNWFERCWFGGFPESTLLNWILTSCYDVYDNLLEVMEDIENGCEELAYLEQNPEEADEGEIDAWRIDIKSWKDELEEIKAAFLRENESANWDQEVEAVKQWWDRRSKLING